jgi:arabinofuranosyltransferase
VDRWSRWLGLFAAALAVGGLTVLAVGLARVWSFTADDSFIWFRYAANLSHGHGPRFNPGDPPAEGYTGFLWLLVMAVPHLLGSDPVRFAKCAGVAATAGTLAVTARFAFDLAHFGSSGERRLAGAVAASALAVLPGTAIHAVAGMETALYTLLLQLFFWRLTRAATLPTATALTALAPLGLAVGLTRPEGNLVVGVGLVALLPLLPAPARARLLRSCALFLVLPGSLYFAWRLWYYGALLPLPFYVTGHFGTARPGTRAVREFLGSIAPPFGLFVLLGLARADRRLLPALAGCLAFLVFFLFPAHRMGYAFRYLHPVVPLVATLSGVGIALLVHAARSRIPSPRLARLASLAIPSLALLAVIRLVYPQGTSAMERISRYYAVGLDRGHIALGRKLASMLGDPARPPTLAISDAGAVPYYSGWRTIDTLGLNDAHIARTGDHSPAYVFSQHPDLVILLSTSRKAFEPILPWAGELHRACLEAGMQRLAVFGTRGYWMWVMGDPGSRFAEGLLTAAAGSGSRSVESRSTWAGSDPLRGSATRSAR